MALGKRCASLKENLGATTVVPVGEEHLEVKIVRSYSFGRKRVLVPNHANAEPFAPVKNPLKRHCSGNMISDLEGFEKSALESLPQDILVKVLCGVEHDDLKQLFHVSKAIREASLIAKQWHFAYSTPKKIQAFRTPTHFPENPHDLDDIEAPNAPKQSRRAYSSHLNQKSLADVSVALFGSPRKGLFMEI